MTAAASTPQDHFDHAAHNERFLDYLIGNILPTRGEFSDWALAVAFYAALQYTKGAILRDEGKLVERHVGRQDHHGYHPGHNDLVDDHLPVIRPSYRHMYDLSIEVRYRAFYKTPGSSLAEVKRQRKALADIRLACRPVSSDSE